MKQNEFYLTITDNDDNQHNAHDIKAKYDLSNFDAYNKGDKDSNGFNVIYDRMCLRFPSVGSQKQENLDGLLYAMLVGRLLDLPKSLKITLHFVAHSTPDNQCHGYFLNEKIIRDLALLNADFTMYGQLHSLSLEPAFPYATILPEEFERSPYHYAEFFVHSFRHKVDEIADRLGFQPNDKGQNFDDLHKTSQKPFYFTTFLHTSKMVENLPLDQHITALSNELFLVKTNILQLGDDVDISYHFGITGNMPNPYQFTIDSDTLNKLAQLRMSVDIDMYFAEN